MIFAPLCHLFCPRSHMLRVCFFGQHFSAFLGVRSGFARGSLEVHSRFTRCLLVVKVSFFKVQRYLLFYVSHFLRFRIRLGLFYKGEVSEDRAAFAVSVFHLLGNFFKAISFPAQLRYTAR